MGHLRCTLTVYQPNQDHNYCNNQQQVDQEAYRIDNEPKYPQDEQDSSDGPKHDGLLCILRALLRSTPIHRVNTKPPHFGRLNS